jgi:hypothetical protein
LVLLPIIGVLSVQAMVKGGFIPPQNRVQIFVAMFLSGTPTSVTYGTLTPPTLGRARKV